MTATGLSEQDLAMMQAVFRQIPAIQTVILFGSRAKGNHRPQSDVDLALVGITDPLQAEEVAETLDRLPMPYRFDVKAWDAIRHPALMEHIRRVGVVIHGQNFSPGPLILKMDVKI
ncbi:MAG: nucleotidyltransferase domain-containing protein [Magnetococcales bacterium]|nr:nucleotidyltransferase domain-containing protein [Magnetococcales bacterium]